MTGRPWNVVVCGTRFGRVYLSALAGGRRGMKLAGILASGSERSIRCAKHYDVPLFTDVRDLPDSVDAACVVISSGMAGGPGTDIALQLLERGIHVLQEHPIYHDELARLLAAAQRHGVVHRMNTLYPDVRPVRQFIAASRALLETEKAVFLDGACAIQLKTSFLEIIGRILGKLRPWQFDVLPKKQDSALPWRTIEARIGAVPCFLRVQNQIHASDPDNHCHLYHQLTVGTAVGSVTLADTHGPVLWRPRPHIPGAIQGDQRPEDCRAPSLDYLTTSVMTPPATTWREAMSREWPDAVRRALEDLRREAAGARIWPGAQFSLSLMQMVHDIDVALGPPDIIREPTPEPASPTSLEAAIAALS